VAGDDHGGFGWVFVSFLLKGLGGGGRVCVYVVVVNYFSYYINYT
jgi:hypothetical protein